MHLLRMQVYLAAKYRKWGTKARGRMWNTGLGGAGSPPQIR
jgi:hypothetical protein